jgi:tetratricopeptide (TPR) repeat protein
VLGQVAPRQRRTAEALDLFQRAMAINQRTDDREGLSWMHCRIGQTLHAVDRHEQALNHLRQAALIARETGETSAEAASLREMGAIHRELGDFSRSTVPCTVPSRPSGSGGGPWRSARRHTTSRTTRVAGGARQRAARLRRRARRRGRMSAR